jgi:hypothetical protein
MGGGWYSGRWYSGFFLLLFSHATTHPCLASVVRVVKEDEEVLEMRSELWAQLAAEALRQKIPRLAQVDQEGGRGEKGSGSFGRPFFFRPRFEAGNVQHASACWVLSRRFALLDACCEKKS